MASYDSFEIDETRSEKVLELQAFCSCYIVYKYLYMLHLHAFVYTYVYRYKLIL